MDHDNSDNQELEKTTTSPKVLTPWQAEHERYLASQKKQSDGNGEAESTELDEADDEEKSSETSEQTLLQVVKPDLKTLPKPDKQLASKQETLPGEELERTDEVKFETVKDLPKSKSFADKLPKMKEARKKRLQRRLIVLVSIFGIAALGTIYYVSPLSYVGKVQVAGNNHVSDESIVAATQITSDDRIWDALLKKDTITNVEAANPRIKSAKTSLSLPNNIKVTVAEYQEVAYVKEQDTLHPVLENGKVLNETSEVIEVAYPVLVGFSEGEILNEILAHFSEVDVGIREKIIEIKSTPKNHNNYLMTFAMEDGNQIIASSRDYYTKINYYPKVAAELEGKGVIDMEAGIFAKTYEQIKLEKAEEAENNENSQ